MPLYKAQIVTHSPEETEKAGEALGRRLRGGELIAYKGELGAGKTAFTRGLALGLGLGDCVYSPTFAIVNEYRGEGLTLYHFDMYRITCDESLETTGFFDYGGEGAVRAVEWSENISDRIPKDALTVEFEITGEESRKITLTVPRGGEKFEGTWN